MSEYRLRPGRRDDAKALIALDRLAWERYRAIGFPHLADEPPPPRRDFEAAAVRGLLLVAEYEGAPAGFLMAENLDGKCFIAELAVAPDHGGRRLGARLIDALPRRDVSLTTFRNVPWAAPYYRKLGFIDCAPEILGRGHVEMATLHARRGVAEPRVFMLRFGA